MNLAQLRVHREHLVRVHDDTLSAINEQIKEAVKKRKVTCSHCVFRGTICDWIFIQAYTFKGIGTSDDGDWIPLPPNQCFVMCPICGVTTLVADHLYRTEFSETATEEGVPPNELFKQVLAKYGDGEPEPMSEVLD